MIFPLLIIVFNPRGCICKITDLIVSCFRYDCIIYSGWVWFDFYGSSLVSRNLWSILRNIIQCRMQIYLILYAYILTPELHTVCTWCAIQIRNIFNWHTVTIFCGIFNTVYCLLWTICKFQSNLQLSCQVPKPVVGKIIKSLIEINFIGI